MKFVVALAALLAVVSADPLQNPGDKKCIATSKLDEKSNTWSLKTSDCTSKTAVNFSFGGNGKALKSTSGSSKNYCLFAKDTKESTKLVLAKCDSSKKGQKWTKVGKNQWKSGQGLCIEKVSNNIVQKKCKTLASDDKSSKQQWVFYKAPAPPAPKEIQCSAWLNKYDCPVNTNPVTNIKCVGADDFSCSSVCCKPKVQDTCSSVNYKCANGYYNTGAYCGGNYPKCDGSRCCAPAASNCGDWNRCDRGFTLIDNAYQKKCAIASGTNLPWCNNNNCCVPQTRYCTDYFRNHKCPKDWTAVSNPASIKCTNDANCQNLCCTPPQTSTCQQWADSGNKCTKSGFTLVLNADKKNGDNENVCCSPDTCQKFFENPYADDNTKTGKEWCVSNGRTLVPNADKAKCYDPNADNVIAGNPTDNDLVDCTQAYCCPESGTVPI